MLHDGDIAGEPNCAIEGTADGDLSHTKSPAQREKVIIDTDPGIGPATPNKYLLLVRLQSYGDSVIMEIESLCMQPVDFKDHVLLVQDVNDERTFPFFPYWNVDMNLLRHMSGTSLKDMQFDAANDTITILMAFQSPDLEVIGLTTIFGNVATKDATRNALHVCEVAGFPEVPVAEGSLEPLKFLIHVFCSFYY
eukprot:Gb_23602 [translate_table: standard]